VAILLNLLVKSISYHQ